MKNTLRILVIDDDTIESMKINRAMSDLNLNHKLIEHRNGEEALKFLLDINLELPDIIFVDLHMPKMNGLEFLKKYKAYPHLNHIPAIVFTTSANDNDLKQSYVAGIAGYIIKPLKYEEYVLKLNTVLEYWSLNKLIRF